MDRSLWLLIGLRGRAWLRRWGREVRTGKGALLAVVGGLVLLPWVLFIAFVPRVQTGSQADAIRRFGPLGLLIYCVLNVALSSGDRALSYAPSEVNFLFCGPYRPRQLLLYKVAGGLVPALLTTLFLTFAVAHHAPSFLSAYVGLFLSLELLSLFSLGIGRVAATLGALAFSRSRKLILIVAGLGVAGLTWSLGRNALALPLGTLLDTLVENRWLSVLLVPFRPFARTFTAEVVWPDLIVDSALAAMVDLGLLALVLGLNAGFLEASAASSARAYARLAQARRGVGFHVRTVQARWGLPMVPYAAGVGPNVWRQLTTAWRSPTPLIVLGLLFLLPVVLVLYAGGASAGFDATRTAMIALLVIILIAPSTVGYDFRPDLDRMGELKTLPIAPKPLVLGQVLTPVLILSVGACVSIVLIATVGRMDASQATVAAAFVWPLNLVLVLVENLLFLWSPYRLTGINSLDFAAMGRRLLLLFVKGVAVGVAAGVSGVLGALAYLATGRNGASVWVWGAAWLGMSACGLALVPLVAQAFARLDVSKESLI